MQDIWFPSKEKNSKRVGRFVDHVDHFTDRHGIKQSRTVTVLLHRVPGAEPSTSLVKNDANGQHYKDEFPLAWDHYLKQKATPAGPAEPVVPTSTAHGIAGTPIEHLGFLGKDHIARLQMLGFYTAEQLADMSDTICNNVGFGANQWRRKAQEHLLVLKEAAPRVAAPIGPDPAVADLQRQLAEANAKIAMLVEAVTKPVPASVPAPEPEAEAKPRRGRAKAEAQPEA